MKQIQFVVFSLIITLIKCQNATTEAPASTTETATATEANNSSVTTTEKLNLANETEIVETTLTTLLLKEFETTLEATKPTTTKKPTDKDGEEETTSSTSTTTTSTTTTTTTTEDPNDLLIPPAQIEAHISQVNTTNKIMNNKIVIKTESDCPTLENADSLSQTQLISRLTHGCRYDRLERPTIMENGTRQPVKVFARSYIYFFQNLEAHDLQFKIHTLLQFRYVDPRLVFKEVAPSRHEPIMGEQSLRDTLWVPHVFLANERSSEILGTSAKDILTSVSPDGTVIISTRIQATLYCWMNLQKFPFDEQHCSTILESWMYNESDLILHWEPKSAVTLAPELHLTEYVMLGMFTNETVIHADLSDLRHGAFAGNYSSLSFTVHLAREMGFYLMDYFIPSVMLVCISWVTFWLQADQSAPRITLGTSTMLTFITLASAQGKTLPKVSYIKASEVWFLGCTGFIFGSLVEFAFVNTIWRRKKNIELKKVNSKYILKSTLTPSPIRRQMGGSQGSLQKSQSCTSLDGKDPVAPTPVKKQPPAIPAFNNYLTVHGCPPIITTSEDSHDNGSVSITVNGDDHKTSSDEPQTWTTMTPQQIAIWIDKRSRLIFPVAFLIFNVFYWTFVYCV